MVFELLCTGLDKLRLGPKSPRNPTLRTSVNNGGSYAVLCSSVDWIRDGSWQGVSGNSPDGEVRTVRR